MEQGTAAHEGFSPAIADRGRQGTATSPPSTTSFLVQPAAHRRGPLRIRGPGRACNIRVQPSSVRHKDSAAYAIPLAPSLLRKRAGMFALAGAPRENSPGCTRPAWRRGWDSNPRYPYEVHTLSRRADSTNSRTSPTCLTTWLPPGCSGFESYGHPDGGGGRGIRTPEEPCGPLIDFESIAFVHSAIPPYSPNDGPCLFPPLPFIDSCPAASQGRDGPFGTVSSLGVPCDWGHRFEGWRAQEELNLRPLPPQGSALSI